MVLTAGSRLGPYEILAPLGAGGMGEVYRARDATLNRDVAIKVLLAAVADDPERLARFKREAQVLASLNHPNIAQVHGFEDSQFGAAAAAGGPARVRALVMELIEGPTLAERIARGPLPLDEALPIATQIAEALESAHGFGVIHRDLKPANIKVRSDGTVKVLDFGLAKALDPDAATAERGGGQALSPTQSPTVTSPALTLRGVILGTAAYMSPEQAKGRPTDTRTDNWAFGCVLYEMLTGTRAFDGEDVADTMVAVLSKEPDWNRLPHAAAGVRPLIVRCLKKDPRHRLQAMGDARIELEALRSGTSAARAASEPTRLRQKPLAWVAAAALLSAVAAGLLTWIMSKPAQTAAAEPVRFEISPPPAQSLGINEADRNIAISPDGRHITYRGGGVAPLIVRSLEYLETRTLEGVVSARSPFFSADGQWIGYFDGRHIQKIPVAGGSAINISEETRIPRGASWGADNRILYATFDSGAGLIAVSANGGEPVVLTTPSSATGERNHWHPFLLPDNRGVLYAIAAPNQAEQGQVAVLDFKNRQPKVLVRPGTQPSYLSSGHLVYVAANTLMAVRFDLDRLETTGDPVPIVDGVRMSVGGTADYAVSRDGTLVYVPAATAAAPRSLVWVDRQGRESPISAPPRDYRAPRLSPDGGRVAVAIRDQQSDISVWDFARESLRPLVFGPANEQDPVWTPDGRSIVFRLQDGSSTELYTRPADGTGTVDRLTTGAEDPIPAFVAGDRSRVLGTQSAPQTGGDIVWFSVEKPLAGKTTSGHSPAEPLVRTPFIEYWPDVSSNGRYVAYQSNESGRDEIYVQALVGEGRWRVSTGGGTRPAWSRNGRELFYVDSTNALMALPVETTNSSFAFGRASRLFQVRGPQLPGGRSYDVAADGRFLFVKSWAEGSEWTRPESMVVVLNWLQELNTKVPAEGEPRPR